MAKKTTWNHKGTQGPAPFTSLLLHGLALLPPARCSGQVTHFRQVWSMIHCAFLSYKPLLDHLVEERVDGVGSLIKPLLIRCRRRKACQNSAQ